MSILVRAVRVVAATLLAVVVLAVVAGMLVPRALGWQALAVTSGSMEPTFSAGDVVLVQPVAGADVREDQVVTFHDGVGGITTHRVASVLVEGDRTVLATRGDANEDTDPALVPLEAVIGEARFAVPNLGTLTGFLTTPAGLLGAAVLLVVVLVPVRGRAAGPDADATDDPSRAGAPALSVVR